MQSNPLLPKADLIIFRADDAPGDLSTLSLEQRRRRYYEIVISVSKLCELRQRWVPKFGIRYRHCAASPAILTPVPVQGRVVHPIL